MNTRGPIKEKRNRVKNNKWRGPRTKKDEHNSREYRKIKFRVDDEDRRGKTTKRKQSQEIKKKNETKWKRRD